MRRVVGVLIAALAMPTAWAQQMAITDARRLKYPANSKPYKELESMCK